MMNINTALHHFLKPLLKKDFISVDATCGNGNDTLFLVRNTKFTYAFDINPIAIDNTKARLKDFSNYKTINKSHVYIKDEVLNADCIIFNLGYLPKVESPTITNKETTIIALNSAFSCLKTNGLLSISCYLKHDGGYDEYLAVVDWLKINNHNVIYTYQDQSKDLAPILFVVKKECQ